MSVNVIELFRSAMPDAVVRQLSTCLGLPPEATAKVMDVSVPALVAGLLSRSSTLEGARSLFAAILSPDVNADVAEQLPRIFSSTTGVTQLSSAGRHLMEHTFERRIDGLSDAVSMQTGVPAHATHAVTGIAGSILMGVLKRDLLDHQGNIGQLPTMLGHQLPLVAPHLNDGLTTVLGLGTASTFVGVIGSQLRAVSAHFIHPVAAAPTPARGPVEPTLPSSGSTPPVAAALPAPTVREREVRHVGLKAKHWLGVSALSALIGALAAMLMWYALSLCPPAAGLFSRNAAASTGATASSDTAASDAAALAPDAASAATASADGKIQPEAAPAVDRNSQLALSVDKNGKPTVSATVQSAAEKEALLGALTKKFGADGFNADIAVDEHAKAADWLGHLDALMPLAQTPGAEVKIDGTRVELSGAAADPKAGWLDRLKAAFGAPYQVSAFDPAQAVANAAQSFRNAAKSLLSTGSSCTPADLVKTLNLQVVNFASRDAQVPQSAIDNLNQSAQLLKSCSANGHVPTLEVAGYSDNVGTDRVNLELSKERAEAVRAFLVKAGVPAGMLVAHGYGNTRPVASNTTESGRFANRRIEFSNVAEHAQTQAQ